MHSIHSFRTKEFNLIQILTIHNFMEYKEKIRRQMLST